MTAPRVRAAWLDRFKAPTADEMLGAFNKQMQGALQHLREKLLAVDGVKEEVSWQGVWRWTLVYRIPGDGERAWAYLVLDPTKPRVSIPITDDIVAELPVKKLSKYVRDGLAHAPNVDGVRWAQWELQGKTQADDLVALAEYKLSVARVER